MEIFSVFLVRYPALGESDLQSTSNKVQRRVQPLDAFLTDCRAREEKRARLESRLIESNRRKLEAERELEALRKQFQAPQEQKAPANRIVIKMSPYQLLAFIEYVGFERLRLFLISQNLALANDPMMPYISFTCF